MAPYTHFNHTLLSTYTLLSKHSLHDPDDSPSPTSTARHGVPFSTMFRPYTGIGPVILQPSQFRSLNATSTALPIHASSPKLGYIGILGVVVVLLLVALFFVRRSSSHRKQKPAKRPEPCMLRSEAARAQANEQISAPSMSAYQLPRDRIRAMNTVPKAPTRSPAEHQHQHVFSPQLSLPPTPGVQTSSFASLSTLSPETPSLMPSTLSVEFDSAPPTPSTASTPVSLLATIGPEQPSTSSGKENMLSETRFSWDFRCRGLFRFSLDAVLDISRANSSMSSTLKSRESSATSGDAEGASSDFHECAFAGADKDAVAPESCGPLLGMPNDRTPIRHNEMDKDMGGEIITLDDDQLATLFAFTFNHDCNTPEFKALSETPSTSTPLYPLARDISSKRSSCLVNNTTANPDSTSSTLVSDTSTHLDVGLGSQRTIRKRTDDDQTPLLAGTTILGFDLDLSPFHIQVVDSRPSSVDAKQAAAGADTASNTIAGANVQIVSALSSAPTETLTPTEPLLKFATNRPLLNKPSHRTLTPASSSIKVQSFPSTACISNVADVSFSSVIRSKLFYMFSDSGANCLRARMRSRMGQSKAASEANLAVLGRTEKHSSMQHFSDKPAPFSLNSGKFSGGAEINVDSIGAMDVLRSSISMPLCVELTYLSAITKRYYKTKRE